MNAPPFPTNPSFGQYFGNWVWSGSRWVCTNTNGVRVVEQVFRASAPYMPSPGLISCIVECQGGGAGGGGAIGTAPPDTEGWMTGGGGGGAGGYSRIALAAGLVLGGVNVTIGAGGTEGTWVPGVNGGDGGTTSFGAFCVANGGQGGISATPSGGIGGLGGAVGVGDVAQAGNPGTSVAGSLFDPGVAGGSIVGGNGGVGFFGGGGTGAIAVAGGSWPRLANAGAPNSGAGGGGGAATDTGYFNQGSPGGTGLCIVTEFCWADAIDDGCGCAPAGGAARVAIGGAQGWDND
jgi:hypothetical protein